MTHQQPGMTIGGRSIGPGSPLYVIAEIGLNHDGALDRALALVDAAAAAGAAAVKLQSIRADRLVAPAAAALAHVDSVDLRAFFRRFELDEPAHRSVAARARAHGLAFVSTPFDEDAVDMLVRVGCDAIKIASGDLTHHHLIARAAGTGLPLVLSTGLSTHEEVASAVACARDAGARQVALLHCVSAYPVPDDQQNLAAIRSLIGSFGLPVGLSDHSASAGGVEIAVALGASLYERHLMAGPADAVVDEAVSSTPEALREVIARARAARAMLGTGERIPQEAELPNLAGSRRALYARRALAAGARVSASDVVALRPANGLDARHWRRLVGVTLARAIDAEQPFLESDLESGQRTAAEERGGGCGAA